jgi:hypothetical protein
VVESNVGSSQKFLRKEQNFSRKEQNRNRKQQNRNRKEQNYARKLQNWSRKLQKYPCWQQNTPASYKTTSASYKAPPASRKAPPSTHKTSAANFFYPRKLQNNPSSPQKKLNPPRKLAFPPLSSPLQTTKTHIPMIIRRPSFTLRQLPNICYLGLQRNASSGKGKPMNNAKAMQRSGGKCYNERTNLGDADTRPLRYHCEANPRAACPAQKGP